MGLLHLFIFSLKYFDKLNVSISSCSVQNLQQVDDYFVVIV